MKYFQIRIQVLYVWSPFKEIEIEIGVLFCMGLVGGFGTFWFEELFIFCVTVICDSIKIIG